MRVQGLWLRFEVLGFGVRPGNTALQSSHMTPALNKSQHCTVDDVRIAFSADAWRGHGAEVEGGRTSVLTEGDHSNEDGDADKHGVDVVPMLAAPLLHGILCRSRGRAAPSGLAARALGSSLVGVKVLGVPVRVALLALMVHHSTQQG